MTSSVNIEEIEQATYTAFHNSHHVENNSRAFLGESSKCLLCRALSTDPVILLLDELSMGLAPLIKTIIRNRSANSRGVAILAVEQFRCFRTVTAGIMITKVD